MLTDPTYQYTVEDIQRYHSGSMSAAEMHEMEKAALSDPMLADALDGYRNVRPAVAATHLNEIRSLVSGQQNTPAATAPVVPLRPAATKWWRGLAAAAVIGVMAVSAWLFMKPGKQEGLAPVAFTPQPSVTTQSVPPAGDTAPTSLSPDNRDIAVLNKKEVRTGTARVPAPVVAEPQVPAEQMTLALDSSVTADARDQQQTVIAAAPVAAEVMPGPKTEKQRLMIRGVTTLPATQAAPEANGFLMTRTTENYFIGKVVDSSGAPIQGVTITTPANYSTLSNVDGSFRLPAKDSVGSAEFAAVGYEKKITQLLAGKVAGIQLSPSGDHVNDVVVVGYGTRKKKALTGTVSSYKVDTLPYKESPYPQGGWDSFYSNLNTEMGVNRSNATKDLHLRFTVENGLPEKFTVIKAPDEATAQKAISIIKKGPKWKTSKRKKKVDVKMKVD
ncbi:anti-sigma factor family protein [Niabella beijingensis]|uniref:anti-sigma factor family protein n=1 Tax=Niabella beijingensis TaxID=2872700 RepID=UPI001CBC7CE7|nr:hypothetical protein [Niabella beijingensis]MBZ4191071.1 hypothetical protein [Niabella beijingensis]